MTPKAFGPIPPEFRDLEALPWRDVATPAYVYDFDMVAARIARLRAALPAGVAVHVRVRPLAAARGASRGDRARGRDGAHGRHEAADRVVRRRAGGLPRCVDDARRAVARRGAHAPRTRLHGRGGGPPAAGLGRDGARARAAAVARHAAGKIIQRYIAVSRCAQTKR